MGDRNKFNNAEQISASINEFIKRGDPASIEQAAQLISYHSQEFFIQFYFDMPNQVPNPAIHNN